MMSNLSAEQRITRATVWLMNEPKYCAFAGLYLMGRTEVKDGIPTACTNGRDEYYGRTFVEGLADEEVRGVKLHETWHKALRHLMVWKHLTERDARLANMAMDYVINLYIHDSDPTGKYVRLPKGGLLDVRFRNMDVGQVFDLLIQEKQNAQANGGGKAGKGQGSEQGEGGFDEHDWSGASSLSDEEKQSLAEEVDAALRQGKLIAGRLKVDMPRGIEEFLAPKVKWEEELRDFVTALCSGHDLPSYRKPNRRYMGGNMVMPSHISETVGRIVIAIDTSGSIWGTVLTQFLSETNALCQAVKPEGVDLLYWDSAVEGHEVYEEGTYDGLLTSTKPRGGGGTEPQCIVDYMKDKAMRPECVVVLTDGEVCSWGEGWGVPVLWCITSKDIVAPNGRSVYVNIE
jgi:predicted metal-dependent peptidase